MKKTKRWRKRIEAETRTNWKSSPVYLLLLISSLFYINECNATTREHFYVHLPKFGLVGGSRPSGSDEPAAVAFLGIPYAAPPTGLLRFMPPGAASSALSRAPLEQGLLMPDGQRASVRAHWQFGRQCVRLPDWLPDAGQSGIQARQLQGEDCLNLNIFVPINESTSVSNSMRQQIKSNYPSQSQSHSSGSNMNLNEQKNKHDEVNQAATKTLWPLPNYSNRMPILVLIHGNKSHSKANSIAYLALAHRLKLIVVTFNYRTGLLDHTFPHSASKSAKRLNHALWDQIGLLHWLKHNAVHFNADPGNLNLLALDNQAAHLLHLLTMSPLARGLFNRVVLVHEEQQEPESALALLSNEMQRELHRKLGLTLGQIVDKLHALNSTSKLFQFIQSANLSQLAQLDRELTLLGSDQLSALTNNPTPADPLLFPHLPALFGQQLDEFAGAALANWSSISNELNYCLYMRQLYANGSDPLSLLQSRPSNQRHSTDDGWQLNQSSRRNLHKTRRFSTAPTFNHLRQINLISQLIGSQKAHEESELDEDSSDIIDGHDRSIVMRANSLSRRAADEYGERADNQLDQLILLESSFDLFIGYLKSKPRIKLEPKQSLIKTNYPNIVATIRNRTSSDDQFIAWLSLADRHFVSSLAVDRENLAQFCTFSLSADQKANKAIKSSFAFVADQEHSDSKLSDWLLHSVENSSPLRDAVGNFVHFGNPNGAEETKEWPNYETLNRRFKQLARHHQSDTDLRAQLELVPYLSSISVNQNKSNELAELSTCLNDIELQLGKFSRLSNHQDDARCLAMSSAGFRSQLRRRAAEDLEPLVRLNRQQADSSQPPLSSITTRNLVNDAPNESIIDPPNEVKLNSSTFHVSSSSIRNLPETNVRSSELTGIRAFLANAYKDTVGKALGIVVCAGLLIFLLNLAIVLIIGLRSAQQHNETANDSTNNDTNKTKKTSSKQLMEEPTTIQLTSAFRANGSQSKAKRLKFDLSGETGKSCENVEVCKEADLEMQTNCFPNEQQVLFMENDQFEAPNLLLSATPLLQQPNGSFHTIGHLQQANCSLLNSPFTSQSTTNSTTGCRNQKLLRQQAFVNSQLQYNHHQSPSSSTTLSLTPIQLESMATVNGLSPQYQLEPIGLIYSTDLSNLEQQQQVGQYPMENPDKTMFLLPQNQVYEQHSSYCNRNRRNVYN